MNEIKLDPKKLLGFKIIADGDPITKLHSPKIGAKGCVPSIAGMDAAAIKEEILK